MFQATKMLITLLILFFGTVPGIESNSHLSTTCIHAGIHAKSKKPRYRNDNGAFFLVVEVRSGFEPL